MKPFLSLFLFFFINSQAFYCQNTKYKIRTIAFYNVENLFDTINNPETFDDDFTEDGKNNYNSKTYKDKIDKISYVISQIGFDKANTSPAIIGLAEVENRGVLEDLINSKHLKNKNYQIVHFDSPDQRGIDVALLYQEKYFIPIDYEKYEADNVWDGLKGYVTNTSLSRNKVIENYSQLWQIEKAFRISKTDLRIRPIYHRLKNRIEAHISICFSAYTVYKELERLLKKNNISLSSEKAIEEIKEIRQLRYILPKSQQVKTKILQPTQNQLQLLEMKI